MPLMCSTDLNCQLVRYLFFYIMPKKGEVSEDANAACIDSFKDLRAYFDQKFSHLKCELFGSS